MEATTRSGGYARSATRRSYLHPFRRRRHKMTRAGLRNLARERSDALMDLIIQREACRPGNDAIIKNHEYPHRRVTLHDIETGRIYAENYAAEISELREQFAQRRIRSQPLDAYYAFPENTSDLRTISTALLEMAARLHK